MGADSGSVKVSYEKGRLELSYDQEQQPIFNKIRETILGLETQSGMKTCAIKNPVTVHPWGGACLGSSPNHGVVDHKGEIYGNPGLYVADGAALPAAVGVPPSLTIAAWAHHVAQGII